MDTVNGLPAHIILVHAVAVLLPLTALILVLTALWAGIRRRLAGANAILAVFSLVLVPITVDSGEWLERRVTESALLKTHTDLGDTALLVAAPLAVIAVIIWWRGREIDAVAAVVLGAAAPGRHDAADMPSHRAAGSSPVLVKRVPRRWLKPESAAVGIGISVLSVVAAGAAVFVIYLIGDSGAQAVWQGEFNSTPVAGSGGG